MEKNEHMPYKIRRITKENKDVKILEFETGHLSTIKPGNYIVLWIPGVSENPFSVMDNSPLKVMIKRVGNEDSFTSHIFRKNAGDEIFIKGPYGNSFLDFYKENKPAHVIAGGIGIAPLYPLIINELDGRNTKVWMGFKTKSELILPLEVMDFFDHTITTDDGTYGEKGLVTDLFEKESIKEGSQFFICGPERMIKTAAEKAMEYADPEDIILSVERYMKCLGQGICGHCEIKGSERTYSTCMDGPVFTYKQLQGGDLGKYARERSGKKIVI